MTMRQQPHPAGSFPTCPACQKEPRHILDLRRRPIGGHLLACHCGETPKADDLAAAVRAFCRARNVSLTVRPREHVTRLQVVPS
jgi:hypothetical protein